MATGLAVVEIPSPGRGSVIAEQAAALLLQELANNPRPDRQALETWLTEEMDSRLSFAAVKSEDTVVGTGGLTFIEDADGLLVAGIVNVVVSPRERRHGLGRRIISVLEEQSRALRAKEIFTLSTPEAVPFYEHLGYKRTTRPSYIKGAIHAKALAME